MHIKRYRSSFQPALLDLYLAHSRESTASLAEIQALPKATFCVFDKNTQLIALGALRKLEGGFCQFDSFITDPRESSETRNDALDIIITHLIEYAKGIKIKGIVAHVTPNGLLVRAKALGFHVVPGVIIALPLS